MNNLQELLIDLKLNHNVTGLKIEFESEGADIQDIQKLSRMCNIADIRLCVKIGGCGALNDLKQIKDIKISSIIAPMIESKYAMEKFVETYFQVHTEKKNNLYINIETVSGFNLLNEMTTSPLFKEIDGIVFGRGDMAKSLGCSVDDPKIIEMIRLISKKLVEQDKQLVIGGQITPNTITTLEDVTFYRLETRKVVFNKNVVKEDIMKALDFEKAFLKIKPNLSDQDKKRLDLLEIRYSL